MKPAIEPAIPDLANMLATLILILSCVSGHLMKVSPIFTRF